MFEVCEKIVVSKYFALEIENGTLSTSSKV